jgi:hypothetical protein
MVHTQRLPGVLPGRLLAADLAATLLVAAAVVVSTLWLTDAALTGWSTRAAAGVVLALGYLGCMSSRTGLAEVYGAQGRRRAPLAYVVTTSFVGALALVSGIAALVWASEAMLVTLVVSMVALWVLATARHLTTDRQR